MQSPSSDRRPAAGAHNNLERPATSLELPPRFRLSFLTALLLVLSRLRFLLSLSICLSTANETPQPLRSKLLALRAPLIGSLFSSLDALMARFLMSLELLPC